jgi:hypothetical protein
VPGKTLIAAIAILLLAGRAAAAPQPYRNFKVTVYIPVESVQRMARDPGWMRSSWNTIGTRLHVDKVFVESYRGGDSADDAALAAVKRFFVEQGVAVAGGMALVAPGGHGQFHSLDYTDPQTRQMVARLSAMTARHFDEFILDDFFFSNTKSAPDIAAKGKRTWEQFRLQLMDEVSRDLILKPALAANPRVRVIIKFPNWYPTFQQMGYDLEREPQIFPEIWTGDETRDPDITDQRLQQYESYEIFRYLENVAPGRNGGGWVDPYDVRYLDRYAEQLWDTILAKAPAINLFQYTDLLRTAAAGARPWQQLPTSFDYSEMQRQCCAQAGAPLLADAAAYALRQVDQLAGELGAPLGLAAYRPYHSHGEDFLRNVAGMIGIPVEMYPQWPKSGAVLLTETAKFDPQIVARIEQHLRAGDSVIITSGLLRALQDRAFNQVNAMRLTGRTLPATSYLEGFGAGAGHQIGGGAPIIFPEVHFYTNQDWAVLRGLANGRGVPLLLMDHYGKGTLYVWVIPENMNDLYRLPEGALNALRGYLAGELPVQLEGPAKVSLFEYGNETFVAESFLDEPVTVRIRGRFGHLQNLLTGAALAASPPLPGEASAAAAQHSYELRLLPHSFAAFREQP